MEDLPCLETIRRLKSKSGEHKDGEDTGTGMSGCTGSAQSMSTQVSKVCEMEAHQPGVDVT